MKEFVPRMRENGENKEKEKRMKMLKAAKPKRNSRGEILKDAEFQSTKAEVGRIHPDRKWFRGTRMVSQTELDAFRTATRTESPYNVLLSAGKVPYSLLNDEGKKKNQHDFENVFGKKSTRKRPKLEHSSLGELVKAAQEKSTEDVVLNSSMRKRQNGTQGWDAVKGQSNRIWLELYKVLDSSDVIVHVLDARDPLGTLCERVCKYIKEEAPHKHLMYVLNKVDLVPTGVTARWLRYLSKSHPTVAYHSNSLTNNYGRNNLLNLLRQLSKLYGKRNLSVGFIGYPNTGKSSIINTLRNKSVCRVAPIPGETKVWQYITLTKKIYLIDCPGVVPVADYGQAVLRGAVRVENVEEPETYVEMVVENAKEAVMRAYGITFRDVEDLLKKLAVKFGRLGKGGEANRDSVARMILHDWIDGKIQYFKVPIDDECEERTE